MSFGNLELFFGRIAAHFHDFHSVVKRRRNGFGAVSRGDEYYVRQIERDFQIVISEGIVLFRIQHLQKRACGIAPVVRSQLVDFVKQEHRVHAARLFYSRYDTAGHCAYVSFSVTAYFRFVVNAAQTHANVFSADCVGNAFHNAGFAHARRPHQTHYRLAIVGGKRLDGDEFHNSVLHLLEAVVRFVQNFLDVFKVKLLFGFDAPRQLQNEVEIVSRQRIIRTGRRHIVAAFQILFELVLIFFCNGEFVDFLYVCRIFFALAELFLYRAHLFAQIILFLTVVDAVLDLLHNLTVDFGNLHFVYKSVGEFFQPFFQGRKLQKSLLLLPQKDVRRLIAKHVGVFFVQNGGKHFFRHGVGERRRRGNYFFRTSEIRFRFRRYGVFVADGRKRGNVKRFLLNVSRKFDFLFGSNDDSFYFVRHCGNLHHLCQNADFAYFVRVRVWRGVRFLTCQQNVAAGVFHRIGKRGKTFRSADVKMNCRLRKNR